MKQFGKIGKAFILTIISIIWVEGSVYCQQLESKSVRIMINNLPVETMPAENQHQDNQPPSIKIMTPSIKPGMTYRADSDEIDLIGEVKDEDGVKFVSVNSDIRSLNEAGIFSIRLVLNAGENRIRLVAADLQDNVQEQFITIQYIPRVVSLADRISGESRYYGLIIGIEDYGDPNLPDLDNPINDAEKIHQTLIDKYTFNRGDMMLLKNPKRDELVNALDYLASRVTPDDNVLIFYAGHGHWDEKANVGYWLPSDAYLSTTTNWFRNSTLVDYLKIIDSKHTLLITDACFAGSIFKTRAGFPNQDRAYEVLYELPSRKAMTSGAFTEVPDRSSFTKFLLERLNENEKTYLSSEQLFSSFRIAVINNSDAVPLYGEIRNVGDEGGDFIFLKKK